MCPKLTLTLFTKNWRMLNTQRYVVYYELKNAEHTTFCTLFVYLKFPYVPFDIFNFLNVTLVVIFYDDVKWLHWCQLGIKTNIWRFPGCFCNDFYILPARKTWKTFPCRSNTKIVLKKVWKTSVISDLQTAGANWHCSKFYIKRQEQIIHHMVFFSSFVDIFHQYMI